MKKNILITNIKYLSVPMGNGNSMRIALAGLSMSNQGGDAPMLTGWNEHPEVEIADFQHWLKCKVEECTFISGSKTYRFKEDLIIGSEQGLKQEIKVQFADGTEFILETRDRNRCIDISVWEKDGDASFLEDKIREYGYTPKPHE